MNGVPMAADATALVRDNALKNVLEFLLLVNSQRSNLYGIERVPAKAA